MLTADYLPFAGYRHHAAAVRLYVFHHAGGSASAYREWPRAFAPHVDAQPVQLPGRQGLLEITPVADLPSLVDQVVDLLARDIDRPYALFGHSMGALLVTELTAEMGRRRLPLPALVGVSGRSGRPDARAAVAQATDGESILRFITRLGGTDPALLADPEMRRLVVDTMAADLRLCSGYRPTFTRLAAPIVAFAGRDDPLVAVDEVRAWRDRTIAECRVVVFPGNHFYLQDHVPAVACVIDAELRRLGLLQAGAR
jgi:surfactin synthase thioesterase subunit